METVRNLSMMLGKLNRQLGEMDEMVEGGSAGGRESGV